MVKKSKKNIMTNQPDLKAFRVYNMTPEVIVFPADYPYNRNLLFQLWKQFD